MQSSNGLQSCRECYCVLSPVESTIDESRYLCQYAESVRIGIKASWKNDSLRLSHIRKFPLLNQCIPNSRQVMNQRECLCCMLDSIERRTEILSRTAYNPAFPFGPEHGANQPAMMYDARWSADLLCQNLCRASPATSILAPTVGALGISRQEAIECLAIAASFEGSGDVIGERRLTQSLIYSVVGGIAR